MQKLKINPAFRDLISPLTEEEYTSLEDAIKTDGCLAPIAVWNGVIVDGHNRHSICTEHDIPFETFEKDFEDDLEAMGWIITNQFARRNLTPKELSYYRGKLYEMRKQADGQKILGQNDPARTSQIIAEERGVTERTIRRDEDFSKAIDALKENVSPQFVKDILSGKAKITQKGAIFVASQPKSEQKAMAAHLMEDDEPEGATDKDIAALQLAADKRFAESCMRTYMSVSLLTAKHVGATSEPYKTEAIGYIMKSLIHMEKVLNDMGIQRNAKELV